MKRRASRYNSNPNLRYAECDKCHLKYHIKDLKLVDEKYNRLNGLLLCKRCYSPTNPQDTPLQLKEKLVTSVEKMRPRRPAISQVNPEDDRVPGKVGEGWARLNPLQNAIDLNWNAPEDPGSSSIIGYKIIVSVPQLILYTVLIDDTNNPAPYYLDTVTPTNGNASYKIAAINSFGIGHYSDEIWWPYFINTGTSAGSQYLMFEPDILYIVTGDNEPIQIQVPE